MEQDGLDAAVWFDVGETMRGGRAGLRNKSADYRRSERLWREPHAYADRISRVDFDSSYSRNRDRRITALSHACKCESGGSSAGTSAIDSKSENASADI